MERNYGMGILMQHLPLNDRTECEIFLLSWGKGIGMIARRKGKHAIWLLDLHSEYIYIESPLDTTLRGNRLLMLQSVDDEEDKRT